MGKYMDGDAWLSADGMTMVKMGRRIDESDKVHGRTIHLCSTDDEFEILVMEAEQALNVKDED